MLSPKCRRSLGRIGWLLIGTASVVLWSRNTLAKLAIEQVGSFALGIPISVDKISIQFHHIELTKIRLWESAIRDDTQLAIESIRIAPTFLRGISTGAWVRLLVVDQPSLLLRFDSHGNLLSKFPNLSGRRQPNREAPLAVPQLVLSVSDASLVIRQAGKQTVTIAGVDLKAQFNDEVDLEIHIKQLLNSSLKLRCNLNSKTLVGQTFVVLEPLCLDTRELSRYAVVPRGIEVAEIRATLGGKLHIKHPGRDAALFQHEPTLQAELTEVTSLQPSLKPAPNESLAAPTRLTDRITFQATNTDGHFQSLMQSQILGGSIRLHAQADWAATQPTGCAAIQVREVQLAELARRVLPNVPVSSLAFADGHVAATWNNNLLGFEGIIEQELTDLQVAELAVANVSSTASCRGTIPNLDVSKLAGDFWANTHCGGVDLAEVSQRNDLPAMVGRCGFAAKLHIPLADKFHPSSYTGQAHITSSRVRVDGCEFEPVDVKLSLSANDMKIDVAPVWVSSLAIEQRPEFSIADSIGLAESSRLRIALLATTVWDTVLDPTAWSGKASVQAIDIGVVGEKFSDVNLSATLAGGKFAIADQKLGWRESELTIGATGSVTSCDTLPYIGASVQVHLDSQQVVLSNIAALLNRFSAQQLRLEGIARTSGIVAVELPSGDFAAKGDLRLLEAQINTTPIGAAQLAWSADSQSLHLTSQSHNFLGGNYAVDARLASLDWTQATLETKFQGIQIRSLCELAEFPLAATGTLEGQLHVDCLRSLNELNLALQIASRDASVGGVPVQFKTQVAKIQGGKFNLQALASALDGSFNLTSSGSVQALVDWSQAPQRELQQIPLAGSLLGQNISLQKCVEVFDRRGALRPLAGQLELRLVREDQAAAKGLLATTETTLSNFRWQQSTLATRIRANATVFPTHIEVKNIDGRVAEGRLSGQAYVTLEKSPKGTFRIGVENVNLRRAAAPVPELARSLNGKASIAATGKLGRQSRAVVKVHASNFRVGELEVREIRLPLTVDYNLPANRIELQCQAGAINAGEGFVFVDSKASWAKGLTTANTTFDIRKIDSGKLLRGNALNIGIIEGKVDVSCVRARRLEDLTGRYHVELTELQNLELPGYDQFTQLVKVPTFAGPSLGKRDIGLLDGRLSGGLLYLDQATLTKSGLLVLADGTATLQGRLALNVVAITNPSGPADGLLDFASSPILLATPAPVALIAKANEALKDRTIHVQVGGTTNRPVLHLQPGKGLTQDALRFVLTTTLGTHASNAALNRNTQLR